MLPNGWREYRLGDLIEEYREKSVIQDQFEVFTSSRSGLIPQSEYYGEGRILSRDNVGFHVIPPGYMTYRSRSDDGNFFINMNDHDRTGIISHFYPVFRFKDGDDKFFLDFLNSRRSELGARSVGSSQKVLSLNALREMRFVLPPLAERQGIAEILSTWDEAIETVEKLITNARDEKKALMQQLLTGKKRLPGFTGKWKEIRLRQLGRCYNGVTYSPKDVTDQNGLLVLRSSNVQQGRLAFDDNVYVRCDTKTSCLTEPGDILICVRNGSRDLIGKTARITKDAAGHAHGAFMSLFRSDEPDYVFQLFQSLEFDRQVKQNLGATINSINTSNLMNFRFIVPGKAERAEIGAFLNNADVQITRLQRLRDQTLLQKNALLQNLLTGKRRVQLGRREAA
jgi:type I restriction enzyme S subunit